MILDTSSGKTYELCPAGFHQVVLADIVDIGIQQTTYGPKHKLRFVWMTASVDKEGKPYRLFQQMTASGHEKGKLYATLSDALGSAPPQPIDTERYIGLQAQALVVHNTTQDGRTFANIKAAMPSAAGQQVPIPADFKRKAAVAAQVAQQTQAVVQHFQAARLAQEVDPNAITDDDIPF